MFLSLTYDLTIMDPANVAEVQEILKRNDVRFNRQDEQILATSQAIQALVVQVSDLNSQIQHLRGGTCHYAAVGTSSAVGNSSMGAVTSVSGFIQNFQ